MQAGATATTIRAGPRRRIRERPGAEPLAQPKPAAAARSVQILTTGLHLHNLRLLERMANLVENINESKPLPLPTHPS